MRLEQVSRSYLEGLPALPGICPDEEMLIRAWLERSPALGQSYSVDVSVPLPPRGPIGSPSNLERMWFAVTRPRIDLLVWHPHSVLVVEVKWFARMSAVTQVLKYAKLVEQQLAPDRLVVPVVLCNDCVTGLELRLFNAQGVAIRLPLLREAAL